MQACGVCLFTRFVLPAPTWREYAASASGQCTRDFIDGHEYPTLLARPTYSRQLKRKRPLVRTCILTLLWTDSDRMR